MKKILAILMCMFLLLTFTVTTFAEDSTSAEAIVTKEVTASESENLVADNDLSVDDIVNYVKYHVEEISVIISLLISAVYAVRRNKKIHGSITTVNNNAVAIAKNSEDSMAGMSSVVTEYKDKMSTMLDEIRRNNEERAQLEASLAEVSKYLKSTRLANVELANEVAELLVLANIPNSKKDELYSRHLAAVNAISEAEREAAESEEVKENEEATDEA